MRLFKWAILMAAVSFVPKVSFAQSYTDGAAAALSEQHATVSDLVNFELGQRTQIALNALVREGNQVLAENGYAQEAQELQNEWDQKFSGYFLDVQMFDLGDHEPLNPWLADYYKKLQDRLGSPILKLFHLDDINTLNYAIPVVFQPKGDRRNGDHWDATEYQKHFVPFSEVVVYWSSYVACRVATQTYVQFKKYCGIAATTLRHLTGSMIAPKLSNYVYMKMANEQNQTFIVDYTTFDSTAKQQLAAIPQN